MNKVLIKDWHEIMSAWYLFKGLTFKSSKFELEHSNIKTIVSYSILYKSIDEAFEKINQAIDWYNYSSE